LSVSVFEKNEISCALRGDNSETTQNVSPNQLNLLMI